MVEYSRKLKNPPIVEAVLDIDCSLPAGLGLEDCLEEAKDAFAPDYPHLEERHFVEQELKVHEEGPLETSTRRGMLGYMLLSPDRRQLVQIRKQGFSWNRLAPYASLADYLQEIERTWLIYLAFAHPVQVQEIRLRYINRILLPLRAGKVELDDYLKLGPRLPDEEGLRLRGFLNQYVAVEERTGHQVTSVLTTQRSEDSHLAIILDITAACGHPPSSTEWSEIVAVVDSLRLLKNRVFFNTLEEKCLDLYR